ncbi:MAG: hypothetical protein RLO48_12455 [Bauldia litoralis]
MNHTAGAAVLQNLSMSSAGGQKESMIDKSGTAPSLSEVDHIPGEETLTVLNGTRPFVAGRTHDAGGDNVLVAVRVPRPQREAGYSRAHKNDRFRPSSVHQDRLVTGEMANDTHITRWSMLAAKAGIGEVPTRTDMAVHPQNRLPRAHGSAWALDHRVSRSAKSLVQSVSGEGLRLNRRTWPSRRSGSC